jgi:excisionase family DNA binding protein
VNQPDGTPVSSWEQRVARRVTDEGEVCVPARIARWLEQRAGVTPEYRSSLRDSDVEAYETLLAIYHVGRSLMGTKVAAGRPARTESESWLSTKEAASELRVSPRCVRNWIEQGKLPATMSGRRWLIRRVDLRLIA